MSVSLPHHDAVRSPTQRHSCQGSDIKHCNDIGAGRQSAAALILNLEVATWKNESPHLQSRTTWCSPHPIDTSTLPPHHLHLQGPSFDTYASGLMTGRLHLALKMHLRRRTSFRKPSRSTVMLYPAPLSSAAPFSCTPYCALTAHVDTVPQS